MVRIIILSNEIICWLWILFSFIIWLFSNEFRLKTFSSSPTLVRICYRNNLNLHVHNYINPKERKVNVQKQPPEVFYKKGVLWNFTKFTGKYLCQSLFFNKVAGLRPEILFKKRLWHRRFSVNFVKFLGTPFLQNTSGQQLLLSKLEMIQTILYAMLLSLIFLSKIFWSLFASARIMFLTFSTRIV